MRKIVKSLVTVVLAVIGFISVSAQQCPPDNTNPRSISPPLVDCQLIANGKGRFWQSENYISAGVNLYITGKPSDIYKPQFAQTPTIYRDVLKMNVSYYAPRKMIPTTIEIQLMSFSPTPDKYKANHKVTIYLDDKPLLSKDAEAQGSIINVEKFRVEIEYMDFLKFTEAKNISFQLGETKIKLKSEDIEVLNELNKTTKQLKFPPLPYF